MRDIRSQIGRRALLDDAAHLGEWLLWIARPHEPRDARVGDAAWQAMLGRYYALTRAQLRRFNGREIDTAGDGLFASFDVPGHESNLELKTLNRTGQPIYVQYSLSRQGSAKPITPSCIRVRMCVCSRGPTRMARSRPSMSTPAKAARRRRDVDLRLVY